MLFTRKSGLPSWSQSVMQNFLRPEPPASLVVSLSNPFSSLVNWLVKVLPGAAVKIRCPGFSLSFPFSEKRS